MLRLAWLQYNPVWEKPEINLRKIDEFLLHWNGADMLILPEMFTTGFTMNPRPFLSVSAKALEWMKKKGSRNQYGYLWKHHCRKQWQPGQ